MKKYIHYCWFGNKPLSKLAEKCLKSWEKYLPDYEIIRWDETNCNINECVFVSEAYKSEKWAFVADYFRTKALYEYGGIYFDTDMEIIKPINDLLDSNVTMLGVEDTGYIAVGVWYEQNKHAYLPKKLLETYKSFKSFSVNEMNDISIPKLLSKIIFKNDKLHFIDEILELDYDIKIYPREYFYPLNMDRSNSKFTDNTCMIHYYDATWLTKKQKLEMHLVRKIGRSNTIKLEKFMSKSKFIAKKGIRLLCLPLVKIRNKKRRDSKINRDIKYNERITNTINMINSNANKDYIVFHNSEWLGVTNATKELFDNLVDCGEILRTREVKLISNAILNSNIQQVIFSSFAYGWKDLIIYLKRNNKNIKIKTYWHGSHSQIQDYYGWERNLEIINLHKKGYIDVMATCKESLLNFYLNQGYNAVFITNKVEPVKSTSKKKKSDKLIIGLYAAKCTDWRKNMFSQMAAVSLIPNAIVDMVPLSKEAVDFAKSINLNITGTEHGLSRSDLMKRMSTVDVVSYVSYSECSPMLPLESLEMGTPCIVGNNHHYFKTGILNESLLINNESSVLEIKAKLEECVHNKEKILSEYNKFSKVNKENSKMDVRKFIEM